MPAPSLCASSAALQLLTVRSCKWHVICGASVGATKLERPPQSKAPKPCNPSATQLEIAATPCQRLHRKPFEQKLGTAPIQSHVRGFHENHVISTFHPIMKKSTGDLGCREVGVTSLTLSVLHLSRRKSCKPTGYQPRARSNPSPVISLGILLHFSQNITIRIYLHLHS